MRNIIRSAVAACILILLTACSSMSAKQDYKGVYYYQEDQSSYISLKEKGKFELLQMGDVRHGTYKIRYGLIRLYQDGALFSQGQFENGYLLDSENMKWIKDEDETNLK